MIKKSCLLFSPHISLPRIDSYWSCEMVRCESEEERCKFFCPQVTPSSEWNSAGGRGETGVLTTFFSSEKALPALSHLTCQCYCPDFLFIYHTLFNISDCSIFPFSSSSPLQIKLNPGSLLLLPLGLLQWQVHAGTSRRPWEDWETEGPYRMAGETEAQNGYQHHCEMNMVLVKHHTVVLKHQYVSLKMSGFKEKCHDQLITN